MQLSESLAPALEVFGVHSRKKSGTGTCSVWGAQQEKVWHQHVKCCGCAAVKSLAHEQGCSVDAQQSGASQSPAIPFTRKCTEQSTQTARGSDSRTYLIASIWVHRVSGCSRCC